MGEDKGRKLREEKAEQDLQRRAEENHKATIAAIEAANKPNMFEVARGEKINKYQDWWSGKSGPIDVRNMPDSGVPLNLYEQARGSADANRIGRGFGTMSGGVNPNFVAKLGQQNQLNKDLAAAGALEGYVDQSAAANTAEGYDLSGRTTAQNNFMANLQSGRDESGSDRYLSFLQRPRQPSFLKQLALAGVQGAAGIGASFATGGMSTLMGGASKAASGGLGRGMAGMF